MPYVPASPPSSVGIPPSALVRWMIRPAAFGLFVGVWAARAALRAG